MIDGCGRVIDYIRISVTDRCNLRCIYCLPEDGVELTSHSEILTFDEIARVCRVLASKGITKVKLTGGEPLVRRGICALVREIKAIPGIENVTITTNGVLLESMYEDLTEAGIDAITVSLDTVDPEVFCRITRRDEAETVIRGLKKALAEAKVPVKINCVPVYGLEEQKILDMVKLAEEYPVHIRFIEMMPIGMGSEFEFVDEAAIRKILEAHYGSFTDAEDVPGNGPCRYFAVPGLKGRIGFISAISHKFCGSCNRVRLTSTGYLKTCLQYDIGSDLREYIRNGCSDEELASVIEKTLAEKPAHHCFGEAVAADRETKGMSQIGG